MNSDHPLLPCDDPACSCRADFAREVARDARERGLLDLAQRWEDEAFRVAPPPRAPGWFEAHYEVMPDGSALFRFSNPVRVY